MAISKGLIRNFIQCFLRKYIEPGSPDIPVSWFSRDTVNTPIGQLFVKDVSVSKIKDFLNLRMNQCECLRVHHGSEIVYMSRSGIVTSQFRPLLIVEGDSQNRTYKISRLVFEYDKSWFCFIIRKYLATDILDYTRKDVQLSGGITSFMAETRLDKNKVTKFVAELNGK